MMVWVRSVLFAIVQYALTVVFAALAVLCFPLGAQTRYRVVTLWNRIVIKLAQWICGIRYEIRGRENIPQYPVIVMAKHQSAWETIALPVLFSPMSIVLKRELLWIPFFGWGLGMISPIAINRRAGKDALKQIVAQGKARMAQGFWVLIFPEGTRVAPGESGRYGIGGAWLAVHTKTPVLPVALNAGEVWPKNSFLKYPGVVTISVGPVISSANKKADALNEEVKSWIETEMTQLPHARR